MPHKFAPDIIRENKSKKEAERERAREAASAASASAAAGEAAASTSSTTTFDDLQLSKPLLRACSTLGYVRPTPIQERCIPVALKGEDILANAVTGSGKSAAFLLPILERLLLRVSTGASRAASLAVTRVLVLAPTRELASQCFAMAEALIKHATPANARHRDAPPLLSLALVVGGLSQSQQQTALRRRPDIVIATPGRLLDHVFNSQSVDLSTLEIVVLDEADRLLEDGFKDELEQLVKALPRQRQTMLFSATLSQDVNRLAALSLQRPVTISTNASHNLAARLVQEFVRIKTRGITMPKNPKTVTADRRHDKKKRGGGGGGGGAAGRRGRKHGNDDSGDDKDKDKDNDNDNNGDDDDDDVDRDARAWENEEEREREAVLVSLCTRVYRQRCVIFFQSKKQAHRVRLLFALLDMRAAELHGNLTQRMRLDALEQFRKGDADFLLATDLAARGLDIQGVETVINFHMPQTLTTYVHRVGRTARAGERGRAVSLVGEKDRKLLNDVVRRATDAVKKRLVAPENVEWARARIARQERNIRSLIDEEGIERELRTAEMKVDRATNLIEHRDEIMSRPRKEWFQSTKEKEAARERAKQEYLGLKSAVDDVKADARALAADPALREQLKRERQREKAAAGGFKDKKTLKRELKEGHTKNRRQRRTRADVASEDPDERRRLQSQTAFLARTAKRERRVGGQRARELQHMDERDEREQRIEAGLKVKKIGGDANKKQPRKKQRTSASPSTSSSSDTFQGRRTAESARGDGERRRASSKTPGRASFKSKKKFKRR